MKQLIFYSLAGLLIVLGFRLVDRHWTERGEDRKFSEACDAASSEIQTGSFIKAQEVARNIFRGSFPLSHFEMNIADNGNRFGVGFPSSEIEQIRTIPCSIPGRPDIAVTFQIKRMQIWDRTLLPISGLIAVGLWLGISLLSSLAQILGLAAQRRFNFELQKSLGLSSNTEHPASGGFISRWLDRAVHHSGQEDSLIKSVDDLKNRITRQQQDFSELREAQIRTEIDLKKNEKFVQVVRQVRHDIRGPLQTLIVMMADKSDRQLENRRIGTIVSSIQSMVEDLEMQEEVADVSGQGEVLHVAEALIQEVIQQKRVLFERVPIDIKIESQFLSVVRVYSSHHPEVPRKP